MSANKQGSERFITPRQAARLADCGEAYIYDRVRNQAFIAERIAGRWQIDRSSFLKWLGDYQLRRHRQPETTGEAAQVFA